MSWRVTLALDLSGHDDRWVWLVLGLGTVILAGRMGWALVEAGAERWRSGRVRRRLA